jgi:FMN phosphatase YigB (HAD superfamily)
VLSKITLTIQRFADEDGETGIRNRLKQIVYEYPFKERLYPGALETLHKIRAFGLPVILSDGDPVYQPLKIQRAGLADAVDGRVMICVHKEAELPHVFATYPARHYVMVDDKPRIHAALELCCPAEFTTILVKQGKYAQDETVRPRPDLTIDRIGDLGKLSSEQFRFAPPHEMLMTD